MRTWPTSGFSPTMASPPSITDLFPSAFSRDSTFLAIRRPLAVFL